MNFVVIIFRERANDQCDYNSWEKEGGESGWAEGEGGQWTDVNPHEALRSGLDT